MKMFEIKVDIKGKEELLKTIDNVQKLAHSFDEDDIRKKIGSVSLKELARDYRSPTYKVLEKDNNNRTIISVTSNSNVSMGIQKKQDEIFDKVEKITDDVISTIADKEIK